MNVAEFARLQGIEVCREFNPEMLVPEERIRAFCEENKCGAYNCNYMCPPHAGSLEEIRVKLKNYQYGILLQYVKFMDVRRNRHEVMQSKTDFHNKILRIEEFLKEQGVSRIWGLSGGNCGLCDVCRAKTGEPCASPDQARISMEAAGIDVQQRVYSLALDSR